MLSGVGAPNGPGNQPFDRWFRYPAGFSPATLDLCCESIGVKSGNTVGDPFAGVGTSGVHLVRSGVSYVGIEAHPLIAELASLKFLSISCPELLMREGERLTFGLQPDDIENELLLVRRSFSPESLGWFVALRESIKSLTNSPWQIHLKWCLLRALRDCANVKVGWPYQRPALARVPRIGDPKRAFMRRVQYMSSDLALIPPDSDAVVLLGDSRDPEVWSGLPHARRLDGIVSSPPYLNNFDYADATRLELYFWGLARSWREMTTLVRSGMIVATTQQCRRELASAGISHLSHACPITAEGLLALQSCLTTERRKRSKGKQYDLLLPSYFSDLVKVLGNALNHMAPGARAALVLGDSAPYGIYIDTPHLVVSAAEELGFSCIEVRQLRKRGLRWFKNGQRHSLSLSEKLVVLQAPRFD